MIEANKKVIRRPGKSVLSVLAAYQSWKEGDNPDKYAFVAEKVGVSRDFVKSCLGLLQYMPTSKNVLDSFKPQEFFIDECQTLDFGLIEKAVMSKVNNTFAQHTAFHTEF